MAELLEGGKLDVRSSLVWLLLAVSIGSNGYSLVNTDDRFRGSDARVLEIRIDNLEKEYTRLNDRYDRHQDTHPDRGLQLQINELREEIIRLNASKG